MLKDVLAPLALATAMVFAFSPTVAHAAPGDGTSGSHWYIGVGIGNGKSRATTTPGRYSYYYGQTINRSSNGFALRLSGGWRYANSRGDAIGIGLTDTGVSLGDSSTAGILGLDLNGKVHLVGAWFIAGRIGTYTGRKFVFYNDTYSSSSNQDGAYYGIGTGIDINPSNSLALTWDRYQISDFTDDSVAPPDNISDAHLDVFLLSYTYTF